MKKTFCVHFSQTLREGPRAGVDTNIAGEGGCGTCRLQEWAVLVRNSAGAGECRFKKTVLRRALVQSTKQAQAITNRFLPSEGPRPEQMLPDFPENRDSSFNLIWIW